VVEGSSTPTREQARLAAAVKRLEGCREFSRLMPEVRVNIVYAPQAAVEPSQVWGVDGRITVVAGMPKASGPISLGVSDHMARLVIELAKIDHSLRAGLNFRWSEAILEYVQRYCTAQGRALGCIDRKAEPSQLLGQDRGSIPWKVKYLVETCGGAPRVFYETRGWGKEPLFFLVDSDPEAVAARAIEVAKGMTS